MRSLAALGRAGLVVTAATAAANLLAYLPPLLAARRLSPSALGELAVALALVAIATMPGVGLQTAVAVAVARRGATDSRGPAGAHDAEGTAGCPGGSAIRSVAARPAWTTALICGGAVLLATPVLAAALRLPLALPPLLAVMTVPAVLSGLPLGVLQGSERFGRLAVGTVLLALGRYAGVLAGLVAGFGPTGSFALGALVAWSIPPVLWSLTGGTASTSAAVGELRGRAVFTAASASLAILVASYADLVLARRLLPPGESGAYAVGAVLTRAAIWGPQVVTIVALPRLVRGGAALRAGLATVATAAALLVAGAALTGGLLIRAAGGTRYVALAALAPYFVLAGALYAVTVFLVNALIADGARHPAAGVWTSAAALTAVAVATHPRTIRELLTYAVAAAAAAALTTGLLLLTRIRTRLISAR